MSAAPDWMQLTRADRGLDRLLAHCELVGQMTSVRPRVPARRRLERELGHRLSRRLLNGLSTR